MTLPMMLLPMMLQPMLAGTFRDRHGKRCSVFNMTSTVFYNTSTNFGDTLETLFCQMISVFTKLIPSASFDPQNVSSLISDRAWDWCDSREDA
jgi:hypothetical protein